VPLERLKRVRLYDAGEQAVARDLDLSHGISEQ
jgi:hypothetical protein